MQYGVRFVFPCYVNMKTVLIVPPDHSFLDETMAADRSTKCESTKFTPAYFHVTTNTTTLKQKYLGQKLN